MAHVHCKILDTSQTLIKFWQRLTGFKYKNKDDKKNQMLKKGEGGGTFPLVGGYIVEHLVEIIIFKDVPITSYSTLIQ